LKWADTPSTAAVGLRDAMTAHLSLVLSLMLAVSALGHCSQRQTIADLRASAAAAQGNAESAKHNADELKRVRDELRACIITRRLVEEEVQRTLVRVREAQQAALQLAEQRTRLREQLYARDNVAREWSEQPVPESVVELWR